MNFISNPQLELAFEFVRYTNKNIYLTGKAGTGKTTFLHQLKKERTKRMVVVAPTGVAAINAGGMTIHSFFQLPFGPYLPGMAADINKNRRFRRQKINLIKSLDLLVIDEISMVRADLLDGISDVLKRFRNPSKPFGGVQVLMIGDLHQLPPVVKDVDWHLLREHYQTAYFFGSHALQASYPVAIELKHIYRQSDDVFIDLLNKVRNNRIDDAVLKTLNSRYIADFNPKDEEGYITLTSHNKAAQSINIEKLKSIKEPSFFYKAKITGDFPKHAYPTEERLEFKLGAQVMFVKNDLSEEKEYYNGKIGRIIHIEDEKITVQCPNDDFKIEVTAADWNNMKYELNEKTKQVSEEIVGTFTQYPLKLAWAITIHKSQGLTFERAIIDAQAAFAHGQVYVALSRCKSFEGIVLRSKIVSSSVKTDSRVQQYSKEVDQNAPNKEQLLAHKHKYQQSLIVELFGAEQLKRLLDRVMRLFLEHSNTLSEVGFDQVRVLEDKIYTEIHIISKKFQPQLQFYFQAPELPEEHEALQERLKKAAAYFHEKIEKEVKPLLNIIVETDNQKVYEQTKEALKNLKKALFIKEACFRTAQDGFSTATYLRTKTDADLDFEMKKKRAASKKTSISNVDYKAEHPELFFKLLEWRKAEAEDKGVLLYNILSTKAIRELVAYLPTNKQALRAIKGIGKVKVEQFGAALIDMISTYAIDKGLETDLLPLAPPKAPKVDTKQVSFELFQMGKSIDEIAEERGYVRGTIEGHLAHFLAEGEIDIHDLMAREAVDEIETFFKEKKTISSSEAKAHFGEKYGYGELKMVLAWMKGGK